MEFEKKTEKFTFGGGTVKAAGAGSISKAQDAPDVPTKHDISAIAKSVGNAAIAIALIRLRSRSKKKKK